MQDFDEAMKTILEVLDLGELSVADVEEKVQAGVAANILHSLSCAEKHEVGGCDYYSQIGISNARAYWRNKAIEEAKALGFSVKDFGAHLQYVANMLSRHPQVDYSILQYVLTQVSARAPKRLAVLPDHDVLTDAVLELNTSQQSEPE